MADAFLGEIRLVAFNFAPVGWAFCDGQLISIEQNPALFTLIGTTYGGDGQTTFGLPNLLGRVPVHSGNGFTQGEMAGTETVTLTTPQMPSHSHLATASGGPGTSDDPTNHTWATWTGAQYLKPAVGDAPMGAAIGRMGSGLPHDNMPPFQAVSFIIALEATYPTQG